MCSVVVLYIQWVWCVVIMHKDFFFIELKKKIDKTNEREEKRIEKKKRNE